MRSAIITGQLCREKFGDDNVFNIGFTTYTGTVTAAHEWDTPGSKCISQLYLYDWHDLAGLIPNVSRRTHES